MTDDTHFDRRSVLQVTGSAVVAGLGAAGVAAGEDAGTSIPSPGCVETVGDADAYDSCTAGTPVTTVPDGTSGFVTDKCYADDGSVDRYELQVECRDVVYVDTEDVTTVSNCC